MKLSNKIYCLLVLILTSNFAFSQVPVRKKVKAPLPPIVYGEPSHFFLSTPNPKDSLQVQIHSIVMNAHHLDKDAFNLGEDDYIIMLRKYIAESNGLKKGILQFYLANIYLSYIDRYSYRVKSTNITSLEKLPEDYRTWAINDFYHEADRLYQEALSNQTELQKQKTENWKQIITNREYIKYKPTLYDMIATYYLSFLDRLPFDYDNTKQSKIEDINKRLYNFHQNDKDKTAFIYLKSTQVKGSSDSQISQLLNIVKDYPQEEFSAYLLYQIASLQKEEDNPNNFINAHQSCERAITQFPNSDWNKHCKNLINSLESKSVNLEFFSKNLPGEYIPIKVTHQNTDNFEISYSKLSPRLDFSKEINWQNYNARDLQNTNKNRELVEKDFRKDNIELKKFNDYKSHQTYVALSPLENGYYNISTYLNGKLQTQNIAITDWQYVKRSEDNSKVSFQVLNSKTGQSFNNTAYIMYQNIDDYDHKYNEKRENKLIKTGSGTTDSSGILTLEKSKDRDYRNTIIYFPITKDYLSLGDSYNRFNNDKEEKQDTAEPIRKSFIAFTDRAIYRPGQKVFYKAILAQECFEKTKVLPKQKVSVTLQDSNGKEVAKQDAITNEFGSISGEFMLPSGGLTGQFYINLTAKLPKPSPKKDDDEYTINGDVDFRVEEYKRPKFQVKINPVKETYKLGDKVKITGKGEAFSGANIANANVKYKIQRQEIRIWRNYYYDYYYPTYSSPLTEIKQGETTTDENGNFSFDFEALADDKSVIKPRSYQYSVSVYVTDINGESQNKDSYVTVGDLKAKLSIDIPERMLQSEWNNLNISVSNLNNEKIDSQGNIKITKLKTEEKILLPKYANQNYDNRRYNRSSNKDILPYTLYSKDLYDAYFPHISYYALETEKPLLKGENVFSKTFKTSDGEKIKLNKNIQAGKYLIEAESIVDRDTIKNYKIVEVIDDETLKNGIPTYFAVRLDKDSYQVGQKMTISFLSDFKEGFVNYRLWKNNVPEAYQQIALKNGKTDVNYTPTDNDLKKGIYLEYDFIHDNDFASGRFNIDVKENINRELEISTQVFRDKIQPGVPEKWILTIKGKDKDKINAEVLAAMYDSSLDKFAKNDFKFTPYVPQVYDRYFYYNYDNYYNRTQDFLSTFLATSKFESFDYGTKYRMSKYNNFQTPNVPAFDYTDIRQLSDYNSRALGSPVQNDYMISEVVVTGLATKKTESTAAVTIVDGKILEKEIPADEIAELRQLSPAEAVALYGQQAANGATVIITKKALQQELLNNVKARTNLNETAFFMPNLYTDSEGNIKLEFNSPEALTQWKLLLFAHTKDLKTGSATYYTQTQKELMLTPNPPRFLRQGDKIQLSTKLDNLSDKELSPDVMLQLFDPITNKVLDSAFVNTDNLRKVKIAAKASSEVNWTIKVPKAMDNVGYRVLAKSKDFSDGEESTIPILADRILLSETLPIFIKEGQNKTFTMNSLLNGTSTSAANFNLTVEMTTNPLWFAVMSIPYLRTYPHECSEQLFSRLYGNMLSTYIMNSSPKIKKIFDEWNAKETPANPLEANQELKSLLIEETPWLSSIKDEKEQMKQLALFFNLNKMQRDLKKAQRDLVDRQNPDGSFSWFPGGNKDKIVSGHILAGFGKLEKMLKGQSDEFFTNQINKVISNSIDYLDKEYYDKLIEDRKVSSKLDLNDYADYFYYRSYWTKKKEIPSELKKVLTTVAKSYTENFDDYSLYHQAMITTFLQRFGYNDLAKKCVATLKKSATTTEENGMYWENNLNGWYWYQAPIETQAMLIEAFAEATPEDTKSVEEMKIWLLRNKQTESWGTTKSTTEAVYALLNYGKSWIDSEKGISMKLGETVLDQNTPGVKTSEAGFFKKSYYWKDITPDKGKLKVSKTSPGVAWGGMYRLYYENMDAITAHNSSNVAIEKKLFVQTNDGPETKLREVTEGQQIRLGDVVVVRLVIKTDRDMEYIHLKDLRASGFEPVNVLSTYKWQNGAGYYESTKDVATHFFFNFLPKGIYTFEYQLKANNIGEFSDGITTFENMYAPAMSAHTEGKRVTIIK
ncbi:MG2 domain-containing protein [Soonwooa sp.]|uniref:alpha-2-macroglobulin family protein n=1 Tax=Soonwooa sp. TaxID=1938592 RepID=UPI002624B730|nr:MG2 domain-containing protein [Soonwooa sp.]